MLEIPWLGSAIILRGFCRCPLDLYWLAWSTMTIPQAWWLKQQKFIFSQFWSPEVQHQGASSVDVWWGLSSWSADSYLLAMSSHGLSSLHVQWEREIWGLFFSERCCSCPTRTLLSWPHLTLMASLKAIYPNIVILRVMASTYEFWEI